MDTRRWLIWGGIAAVGVVIFIIVVKMFSKKPATQSNQGTASGAADGGGYVPSTGDAFLNQTIDIGSVTGGNASGGTSRGGNDNDTDDLVGRGTSTPARAPVAPTTSPTGPGQPAPIGIGALPRSPSTPTPGITPSSPVPPPTAPQRGTPPWQPGPNPPGTTVGAPITKQGTRIYVVQQGDSLGKIASRFGYPSAMSLYYQNQYQINSVSTQRGNPVAGGPWNNIFPGEELRV